MEALGIVFALKEFCAYIEGSELTVVRTDNSALCSLFKRKDLTGRLAKYQLVVQEYNIKIEYRKGKTNKFCDYISRYITINAVQTENTISLAEIIKEQKQVRKVCELYDAIANNIFPSNEVKRKEIENEMENFTVINGAVHRRNPIRLFIPYVLRSRLINSIHCCPLVGGHLGIKKTLAKILPRFWWDGINSDVKKIIMGCEKCQQRKTAPGQKILEPLNPIPPSPQPFYRIHTDIVGPLPETTEGYKYMLTTIDSFSKWAMASPMPDQTANSITQSFIKTVITKVGIPHIVVTDNGRQFLSQIFKDLLF